MRAESFDEVAFFRSIAESGARALLIGRRAMIVLGLPVLTADYDFWISLDDVPAFNEAAKGHEEVAHFDDVWQRRQRVAIAEGVEINVPSIDDLIVTKRFALRAKDLEDIRMLEMLKAGRLS